MLERPHPCSHVWVVSEYVSMAYQIVDPVQHVRLVGMIDKAAFGRTGHQSTRAIFGAAALAAVTQKRADRTLELIVEHGVNHIDVAASYGDAELRIAPWLRRHPKDFFVATKTGQRTYGEARDEIRRSLDRLGVDHIDMIQLHDLVDRVEWETALGAGGALEAAVEARDEGLVDFIGVTGHGIAVAAMHRLSLERFPFDSVLLPYNFPQVQDPRYAHDFEALIATCFERGVAVQTIKAIVAAPWDRRPATATTWYEPLTDPEDIELAVHWVLGRDKLFIDTVSDVELLPLVLRAAATFDGSQPSHDRMRDLAQRRSLRPMFA